MPKSTMIILVSLSGLILLVVLLNSGGESGVKIKHNCLEDFAHQAMLPVKKALLASPYAEHAIPVGNCLGSSIAASWQNDEYSCRYFQQSGPTRIQGAAWAALRKKTSRIAVCDVLRRLWVFSGKMLRRF